MPRKRSTADYLKDARANRKFVPSLNRYKGRRGKASLSPQEKSAITRAKNNLRKHGGTLIAIPAKQARRLKKAARIGDGITAIAVNGIDPLPGTRVSVDKQGNPVITQRAKGKKKRRWRFVPTVPALGPMVAEAEKQFAKGASQVAVWNTQGLAGERATDIEAFARQLMQYFTQYGNIEQWVLGILSLVQS